EAGRVEPRLADAYVERRQEQWTGGQHDDGGRDQQEDPRWIAFHREGAKALPRRPFGRTSSRSTSSRNIVTLGKAGPIYWAVKVLTRPSSSPPSSAPAGLPTPPSTTTTKAFRVHPPSSFGEKGRMMPITMP